MEILARTTVRRVVHGRKLQNIDEWLRDQINYGPLAPTARVYEEYEILQRAQNPAHIDPVRDRLALYLFSHAAENCTSSSGEPPPGHNQEWEKPAFWLKDPNFLRALYDFHKLNSDTTLPPGDVSKISRHDRTEWKARGLTSFILRVKGQYALKLLKPWYRHNPTVIGGTGQYAATLDAITRAEHGTPHFAPALHGHGESWILMEYVEGPTAREYWEEHLRHLQPSARRIEKTGQFACALAEALDFLSRTSSCHGDLSPWNVIVTSSQSTVSVKLIDFGENYLIDQHIGSYQAFLENGVYIDPESFEEPTELTESPAFYASLRSDILKDIYSFAVTLVELLGDETLSPVAGHKTPFERLGKLRTDQRYRGMDPLFDLLAMLLIGDRWERAAGILTDAPQLPPETLKQVRADSSRDEWRQVNRQQQFTLPSKHYPGIRARLEAEFQASAELAQGTNRIVTLANFVRAPFALSLDALLLKRRPSGKGDVAALLACSLAAATVSIALLMSKLFSGPWLWDCSSPASQANKLACGAWLHFEGLPGLRLLPFDVALNTDVVYLFVGLSLAFMGFLYYANIFGDIDREYLPRSCTKRLALVAVLPVFIGPILFVSPSTWPTVGFLGMLLVALNNYSFAKLANAAKVRLLNVEDGRAQQGIALPITTDMDASLAIFVSWQITASIVCALLGVIAILTAVGVVPNLWLFAYVILGCNCEGIRRSMVRHAPRMRSMLMQLACWGHRLEMSEQNRKRLEKFRGVIQMEAHQGVRFKLSYDLEQEFYRLHIRQRDFADAEEELQLLLRNYDVRLSWLPLVVEVDPDVQKATRKPRKARASPEPEPRLVRKPATGRI